DQVASGDGPVHGVCETGVERGAGDVRVDKDLVVLEGGPFLVGKLVAHLHFPHVQQASPDTGRAGSCRDVAGGAVWLRDVAGDADAGGAADGDRASAAQPDVLDDDLTAIREDQRAVDVVTARAARGAGHSG